MRSATDTDHPRGAARRVLITDDDHDFAASVVDALAAHDYETRVVHDSKSAREALGEFAPGVALIDQRLGHSSGVELCADLLAAQPDLLCVMMTGYASVDTAIEALKNGAYDYLRKPFDPEELLATIDRCFVRLENERLRREHDHFHRTLFEKSPMGLALCRIDGQLVDVNPAFARIIGRGVAETLGLAPDEITPPEYAEAERLHLRGLQRDGHFGPFEKELLHEDGHRVPVRISSITIQRDGRPFIWSSVEDVSDVREARRALLDSERDLRITLDSIGDAVIATDARGRIARMNPVASALTGWTAHEAGGHALSEVFHVVDAESRHRLPDLVEEVWREGRTTPLLGQAILVARDGTERHVAHRGAPIRAEDGGVVGTVLVFRDVTEEHDIEERLRHAQKMEAVGQLAGGVAHDFNNLLMVVLGNAELLSAEFLGAGAQQDPELGLMVRDIVHACERARSLTMQLLSFSRRAPLRFAVLDAHAQIREVAQFLGHSLDRRIAVELRLDAPRCSVRADSSQLHHALLNLAVNARDAMPEGGHLTLATRNQVLEQAREVYALDLPAGTYLEIAVSDTGQGIAPDVQARVFEPFFTTKANGQGTGLGLASVYGCVQSHGGHIQVESAPGRGTTFRVLLPLTEEAVDADGGPPSPPNPPHGTGRVLVVDDEELVRHSLERSLASLGYDVTLCADGTVAIETVERCGTAFDIAILDLVMPGLGGEETFRRLRALDPELPILLASGYSEIDLAAIDLDGRVNGYLAKPFHMERLASELARHLRSRV